MIIDGMFVGTTTAFDTDSKEINTQEFRDFINILQQNINNISNVLNMKTSGSHPLGVEFVTGNTYFPNPSYSSSTDVNPVERPEFSVTIDFGSLPNTATKSVAHGITINSNTVFTRADIMATDTTAFKSIKIPYSSTTAADIIEFNIDSANINIITGKDMTSYDKTIVTLYYLKF